MRIALISDFHSNLAAFEAVLADLRETSPDLVFHGGDLAHGGSSPAEIVDQIRSLGWHGVVGNTDELLFEPQGFEDFAAGLPQLDGVWAATREMAAFSRDALGAFRMEWLRGLPRTLVHESFALVHASAESTWRSPSYDGSDADFEAAFGSMGKSTVVFGHLHRSFIRQLPGLTVINTGSVSLSYDGDPRATYLLLDDGIPSIQRVVYDVDREIREMAVRQMPYANWVADILKTAQPSIP